jgi:serine/threonine-protein kinase
LHSRLAKLAAQHQRMAPDELIRIGANVAEAIDYAHQRGLIHRDIKPANVMINPQGQAVLMDFGIAKIMGSAAHTATGTVVGTAQYVSPEQVRGHRPTERSDIYSLGVTLFEMAAGKPPFDGDSAMSIMLKHVNDPVPDLRSISPGLPTSLVAVIERTLAKDPAQRYQSAGELAAALRQAGASRVGASQATVIEPMPSMPAGATVLEPTPSGRPSRAAPSAEPPAAPPPVHRPAAPAGTSQPPAQPIVGPQVPSAGGKRGVSTGLLIGAPLVLVVCLVLGVIAVVAANNLLSPEATPTVAATAAPTAAPATDIPTAVPTEAVPAPTATAAEPTEPVVVVPAGMVSIPPGEFNMGSDAGQADELPVHLVRLSAFYIDQFEVTNGRYQTCVNEGVCQPPANRGSFTRSAYFGATDFADYPVLGVTWDQAASLCAWEGGKRLPTEAEWEYAATGGDGRRFPWGNEFDGTLLPTTSNDTVAVGSFPGGISPFGIYDMAGNVLEWVADYYDSLFYAESVEADPIGPDFGDERVLRGGSFGNTNGDFYTATRRYHLTPNTTEVDIGFRCALTAP